MPGRRRGCAPRCGRATSWCARAATSSSSSIRDLPAARARPPRPSASGSPTPCTRRSRSAPPSCWSTRASASASSRTTPRRPRRCASTPTRRCTRRRRAGGGVHVYGVGTVDPLARLELAARLRRGIERGELELHHQPILRLADRGVMGVESLVRWRDPRARPRAARRVHPRGRAHRRDRRARGLGAARGLRAGARVGEMGPVPERRASTSRRASCAAPTSRAASPRSCNAHGIEPGRFVLEITESAWSLEASRLLPVLGELRAAGFALAIDDFGAGYSSLWRLRELPVQIIKVDRAFLRGVPDGPAGRRRLLGDPAAGRRVRLRRRGRGRRGGRARRLPGRRTAAASRRASTSAARCRARDDGAARGVDRLRPPALTARNCGG